MAPPSVPASVKEALNALPMAQSVAVRSYIAGLRDIIKDLEANGGGAAPADEGHTHMHGGEVCHADHSKEEKPTDHSHEHKHTEACTHESHDHGHKHDESCNHAKEEKHGHDHGHQHDESCNHAKEEKNDGHDHGHKHAEPPKEDHGHSHEHGHGHGHVAKKQATGGADDAPFGGSWGAESQMDATKK